jgi:tRNA(Ser,Leu) C12 N-acetylase TAN1
VRVVDLGSDFEFLVMWIVIEIEIESEKQRVRDDQVVQDLDRKRINMQQPFSILCMRRDEIDHTELREDLL